MLNLTLQTVIQTHLMIGVTFKLLSCVISYYWWCRDAVTYICNVSFQN